jgi:hypothetical protein
MQTNKQISPCPKPERPIPQRDWREKAIETAKKIVRLQGECSRCGRKAPRFQMHGVHILPVRFGNTCADINNIECMCAFCHTADNNSAHLNERDFHEWFDEKYPGRRELLQAKARQICHLDFIEIYSEHLERLYSMLKARRDADERG